MITDELKRRIATGIYQTNILNSKGRSEKAFEFGKQVWTSGLIHGIYVNHRIAEANPTLRNDIDRANVIQVQHYLVEKGYDTDEIFIASSADAGISWGSHVARMLEVPFVVMRKNEKIMGAIPAKRAGIVVDDLNSTYSTFEKIVDAVEREGAYIHHGFFNVDHELYQSRISDRLKEKAIDITSNITGRELVLFGASNYFTDQQKSTANLLLKSLDDFALATIFENPGWIKAHERFHRAIEYYKEHDKEEIHLALEALI